MHRVALPLDEVVEHVDQAPGERRSVVLFAAYAFVLLVCYYFVKPLREPLLLVNGSAQLKSYACAAIGLVLMVLVPIYGAVFRRAAKAQLVRWITLFFAANLVLFYGLGRAGVDIGFAYYVWVGVFGVTMLAQFWAHAAHSFDVQSGRRLFPFVMAGATLGALAGPALFRALFPVLGRWNTLLVAAAILVCTLPLVARTRDSVPVAQRNRRAEAEPEHRHPLGGFHLVLRDRYLLLLALLMVLLNCVNTMGEYIVTDLVVRNADALVAADSARDKGGIIAAFYGNYFLAVNALTVLLQLLVVGRVFRRIGVAGALLVVPAIAAVGYGLIAFFPIFNLIWAVKVLENGVDYSLMNTARQAVYLPLPAAHQYEGKTAVDTFFWRLGDVVQAALVYIGVSWLGLEVREFALLNALLAVLWIALAALVARSAGAQPAREQRPPRCRRPARVAVAALGVAALGASAELAAAPSLAAADAPLFASSEPLEIEIVAAPSALCRPDGGECVDAPGTLIYRDGDGEHRIGIALRARGRWQRETADCRLPALFVSFDDATTAGTPFAGQRKLALTTHCRDNPASYEQFLLKELLAYRIYNVLADDSLAVRLAHITYDDPQDPRRTVTRYGFFTEHFDSLAARTGGRVVRTDDADLAAFDARTLAVLELFEYMIGNTDWSAVFGHNVLLVRRADGAVTPVPFDFDYSGLVDAPYAAPAPKLRIRSVRERVYRGFCNPNADWDALFALFTARRARIEALVDELPGLDAKSRATASAYIASFYAVLASPERRGRGILAACRESRTGASR